MNKTTKDEKRTRRKAAIERSWLIVAQNARWALENDIDFDDKRSIPQQVAAILILNGLTVRDDCPPRFRTLANASKLRAEMKWCHEAKQALAFLRKVTRGPAIGRI